MNCLYCFAISQTQQLTTWAGWYEPSSTSTMELRGLSVCTFCVLEREADWGMSGACQTDRYACLRCKQMCVLLLGPILQNLFCHKNTARFWCMIWGVQSQWGFQWPYLHLLLRIRSLSSLYWKFADANSIFAKNHTLKCCCNFTAVILEQN